MGQKVIKHRKPKCPTCREYIGGLCCWSRSNDLEHILSSMKDFLDAEDRATWEETSESGEILFSAMKYKSSRIDIPEHLTKWRGQASGFNIEELLSMLVYSKLPTTKQPTSQISWIIPVIAAKDEHLLDELLHSGRDPRFIDEAGMTPLMHLVNEFPRNPVDDCESWSFAFNAFRRLLCFARDRQINIVNSGSLQYRSPLQYACKQPHVSRCVVDLLLIWGARVHNIDPRPNEVPPILDAVANDRLDIVQLLEEYGADVNYSVEIDGTIVSTLSRCQSIAMFHALLTLGAYYDLSLHYRSVVSEANKKYLSVCRGIVPVLNLVVFLRYFLQTAGGFILAFLALLSYSPVTSVVLAVSIAPEHSAVLMSYPGAIIFSKLSRKPDYSRNLAVIWILTSLLLFVNVESLRFFLCILLARSFAILGFDSFAIILFAALFVELFLFMSYIPIWVKASCLRLFFLFWCSLSWTVMGVDDGVDAPALVSIRLNNPRYEAPPFLKKIIFMSLVFVNLCLFIQPPFQATVYYPLSIFGIDPCFYDGSVSSSLCTRPFAAVYHPYLWSYLNITGASTT